MSSPYRSLPPSEKDEYSGEPPLALIVACGIVVWLLLELGPLRPRHDGADHSAPPFGRSGVAAPTRHPGR